MKFVLDQVWIRENPESVKLPVGAWDENFVMSRWHEDETLDEALWEAVFSAYTAEHDEVTVLAVVRRST